MSESNLLKPQEVAILRSQFVTASKRNNRYRPWAFTEIVCVGIGLAFGLSSQIATSNAQPSYEQGFTFSNPVTTT
jgi:hypothetical protein